MALVLALFTFVVVVAVIVFLTASFSANRKTGIYIRRLASLQRAEKRKPLSGDAALIRDEVLSGIPSFHRLLMRWRWGMHLRDWITQSGLNVKPGALLLYCGIAGLGSYMVVFFVTHQRLPAMGVGAAMAAIPFAVIALARGRRFRKFEQLFPQAVDLLGRAIRAGHAVNTGLEMIAKELSEPVAGEFRLAFEEQNFGLPLKEALLNFSERMPLVDVRFFVSALMIQKETGGNLAEILDNLSHVIRERMKIRGEVRIRTAQGRLTAGILISLPLAMGVVLEFVNPSYIAVLFTDPVGPMVISAAALLQIIGAAILWKVVTIEV